MRHSIPVLLLAFAALTTPLGASAQYSEDEGVTYREVDREGTEIAAGRAVGVVDAPIDQVTAVLHDYANYVRFMPKFRASRVLSQRGDDALVYVQVSVARDTVSLWANLRIRSRMRGDRRVITASMQRGNVSAFDARWELTPVDDGARTRVSFQFFVDPDLPIPSSLATHENISAVRRTMRRLRRRMAEV